MTMCARRTFRCLVKKVFFKDYPDYEDHIVPQPAKDQAQHIRLGTLNPDKKIGIAFRLPPGSGFFSNYRMLLAQAIDFERQGLVPVFDQETFWSLYQETVLINGTRNVWEYYFKPVSGISIADAWKSRDVSFGDNSKIFIEVSTNEEYRRIAAHFAPIQDDIQASVVSEGQRLLAKRPVLGIHFRGKEHNTTPRHCYCPTPQQMFKAIDFAINTYGYESLFLVTEEADYLDLLKTRYGTRLTATEAFRTHRSNSYNLLNPRTNHRYLLGREVLIDTILLSRCDAILASDTGIANQALALSLSCKRLFLIDNGYNFKNIILAKYSYPIRRLLPRQLGGLPGRLFTYSWPLQGDRFYPVLSKLYEGKQTRIRL